MRAVQAVLIQCLVQSVPVVACYNGSSGRVSTACAHLWCACDSFALRYRSASAVVQAALDTLKRKSTSSVCEDEAVQSKYNKALSRRTRAEAGIRLLELPAAHVDGVVCFHMRLSRG